MSHEIVSIVAQGSGVMRDMPSLDLLMPRHSGVKSDLIGGNHKMRQFISPEKGHKHVTQLNPTLFFVEPLLAKIKEPSLLCLRGCESLLRADFPFDKFKALTALEISGITHMSNLPEKQISEMTQLQTLNLSRLPIQHLPHGFLSNLTNLRSLVLSGCPNLHSLPETCNLSSLECLDLSDLLIATLPDGFFDSLLELSWVILRGCSNLGSLPSTERLEKLEVLDLSHCTALQEMQCGKIDNRNLKMLDLSYTALPRIPYIGLFSLTHIFLRDTMVTELHVDQYPQYGLRVLDLSGAQNLENIGEVFKFCVGIVVLDLSRTGIESIVSFLDLEHLRKLILRECTRLVELIPMRYFKRLEVLDISGCETLSDLPEDLNSLIDLKELNISGCCGLRELREGLFDQMSCLEKLDLSKTIVKHLPSVSNLINLQTLNLSHTSFEQVPDLSNLVNLSEFVLPESDKLEFSDPNEFHLVSTFISDSGFDRFKYEFQKLDDLISKIEKSIKPAKSNFRSTCADLKYLLEKIDNLESSHNCNSSEELLLELMNVANDLSADDFPLGSPNFKELVRLVAKLKLLVPPPKKVAEENENEKKKKKKKPRFTSNKDAEESVFDSNMDIDIEFPGINDSFESLTDIQRKCLLYFAVFLYSASDIFLEVKESVLIQLWYGEGFIDPTTYLNPSTEMCMITSVKEMGHQILEVLEQKDFISKVWINGNWFMKEEARNFVIARAKEVSFFNFDQSSGKLTPQLLGSHRACLLKSQDRCPSSCKLWMNYTSSFEKLESFEKIHTLLYVDEPIVDIRTEWFSNMKYLRMLYLVSLQLENEEQIDIMDLKFLEELKNMKQLRLLSLEGFSVLQKLPDSVCKLTNLRMLNLGYCSNLQELPAGIGSLQNLTHLELTECHLLSELPKGLRLLSRLEVLKGFVITYKPGGRQHTNACTLRELLKLESLQKLNIVVNRNTFPSSKDLHVLREMKNLYNLKITWTKNYDEEQEPDDGNGQEAFGHSRWQQLKCWKQQIHRSDNEELLIVNGLNNLKKLVLCCFPLETAPDWLQEGGLQKLERLYILGGNLTALPGHSYQEAWNNIKNLRLKYLPNLDANWDLKYSFLNAKVLYDECPLIEDEDEDEDEDEVEEE